MNVEFYKAKDIVYFLETEEKINKKFRERISWLLEADYHNAQTLKGTFIGPRKEIITPWSTNAVEIMQNAGVTGIKRIERFRSVGSKYKYDPMLEDVYRGLNKNSLEINMERIPVIHVKDIRKFNIESGLALSEDEIEYLENISKKQKRLFTDSEIFGFAQANSEHCRHKIFNGEYIIDGKKQKSSLFKLIKKTSNKNRNDIVSAYSDNCAFLKGYNIAEFSPQKADVPGWFRIKKINSVISLKAETHNFPTTVEPFMGAATGSGGEIRDRMGGGRGSIPLAGTACYMTSYPRHKKQNRKYSPKERDWLYQTPQEILTKASNGASDYGNKFGQPLIVGSLLTFEHKSKKVFYGYDKTIMLAGGVGYTNKKYALKRIPKKGDKLVMIGGDNYRIGMGGGAVSSVDTGAYSKKLELNAVQRSNPEMQKRAMNAIRGILESTDNPIVTIHDHGAGGHVNAFSELFENTGGIVYLKNLPIGDPTLSDKEIIGNESQERMGLIIKKSDWAKVKKICEREKAPVYMVGKVTGDDKIIFKNAENKKPIDIDVNFLFGKPPRTIIDAKSTKETFNKIKCPKNKFDENLKSVLMLEGVGCKDWLTNKVDRSVTGRIAQQQCVGKLQLPLSGVGITTLDYTSNKGISVSMGHNPIVGLIDAPAGSVMSIAESLTNMVFAPLRNGIKAVSLSANWMWPSKMRGEDARLYSAVKAASDFAIELGINIPTGKDSLSMTQKYEDGNIVRAPGTVIISASGACDNILSVVTPDIKPVKNSKLLYINMSGIKDNPLGGSSYAQTQASIGQKVPTVKNAKLFVKSFNFIQKLVKENTILAGQDISSGGFITALLEMAFTGDCGIELKPVSSNKSFHEFLFCEKPGVIIQVNSDEEKDIIKRAKKEGIDITSVGKPVFDSKKLDIKTKHFSYKADIKELRKIWFTPSYQMEKKQVPEIIAKKRFNNFDKQPLSFSFPTSFNGKMKKENLLRTKKTGVKAAIIREKGTNGEREMAYALFAAGFDVKDVMMTDITSGRENLEDIQFAVFCGGFSNSDVLGSAKGWAGSFRYNKQAESTLKKFYKRTDTLSLGVCNGCQLMVALDLVYPKNKNKPVMLDNDSKKFESSFINVDIPENTNAILFDGLQGSKLGIWVAHGEGKMLLEGKESEYDIALKYSSDKYPANPNGSSYNAAGIVSHDGRHLAMMPHLERAIMPWQWAYYPQDRKKTDKVTPWLKAFINAKEWIKKQI